DFLSEEEMAVLGRDCSLPSVVTIGKGSRIRVSEQQLGDSVELMRLSSTGSFRVARPADLAAKSREDDLIEASVDIGGNIQLYHDGRLDAPTPGGTVLFSARSEWDVVIHGNSEAQSIKFSRDLLPPGVRDIGASVRRLHVDTVATHMFARYLDQLDRSAADLTAVQRYDASQAAINLLVMALRSPDSAAAPDGSDPVLLDMVKAYVRGHLAEPMSVDQLARQHHVSEKFLYRIFERIDTTPGAYVRTQRLLAARNILIDPENVKLETWRVATMTGFASVRTFNRAFYREFGTTPNDWRQHGNEKPH
ncbi:AraC family transcriptional regulator, partial [Actinoplanes sp. TBRC 11911]|uniref:AraC family transcriptional regulator n=1 Tax=Actinoplanes sp. TBRC 11911 TaxID=2729386 RepID=UPI00145F6107